MWLQLYLVLLTWAWLHSLLHTRLHLFVLVSVPYVFHYFLLVYKNSDPRPWSWFRSLSLWDSLRKRHFGGFTWAEGSNWADYESTGPRIFVVHPLAHETLALLLTFGLHGQETKALRTLAPLIVVPDYMFLYPGVANLLQWAGAVPFDRLRLERALREDAASLVIVMPGPDDGVAGDLEQGSNDEDQLSLMEWLCSLPSVTGLPVVSVPTLFRGPEGFYLRPISSLSLGLCCSCIPRAGWLRVGLNRPVSLSLPASEVLEKIRSAHHYLATVTKTEVRENN